MLWSDGSISPVEVSADAEFDQHGGRKAVYTVKRLAEMPPVEGDVPQHAGSVTIGPRTGGACPCTASASVSSTVPNPSVLWLP